MTELYLCPDHQAEWDTFEQRFICRKCDYRWTAHDVPPLLEQNRTITAALERCQSELAKLNSHDHAPCVLCDPLRQQLATLTAKFERCNVELRDTSFDLDSLYGACWHCLQPDSGDPERHEHGDGKFHWHHYIDPGDGLPSPCANSELLERIFQSLTAKPERDKGRIGELLGALVDAYNAMTVLTANGAEDKRLK